MNEMNEWKTTKGVRKECITIQVKRELMKEKKMKGRGRNNGKKGGNFTVERDREGSDEKDNEGKNGE